ncbi:CPBP family intramembrane glutamic endopeptidase [Marinitenerispora sediminis]|uniref:CPBP family intramembrane metalloprotease domain-containing protein n=1 Tax=Marinitenerispora sediminis TaxID=1931232 RepID=A0A368T4Y7_9ACTN|nr:CPBP family intramembrane glutamic endopeptidase [Marinitenerispora sediminis]RCV56289.1 CPBP family intramembrane metalloprotease domain-containing protein [Marinitenerispora sediminis]RCV58584.1 CPBP family intramembrane metalloprotease domain-containing protein [Marinitenerispora sediminis]RCV61221.1 CPBP family intramembrane metalloprotease domain-containing protein [Marinitenerispora sediminis]
MRLVWQFAAVAAVAFLGGQGVMAVQGDPWLTLAIGLLTAVVSVPVYRWVVRRTERRPVTELAGRGAVTATGLGTLIGVAVFAAVIVNIAFLGGYQVHGLGSVTGVVGLLGFMAAAAVTEELMWRGVLFRIIEQRTGTWIALALTGLVFGLSHLLNPHASLWGAIAIAIEAGGMLTAAYVATRSLWLPIGLHFGWNFAASAIFSTEVSGNDTAQGLLDATMSGPVLLTGGEFGPEGSLYSIVFCVLATIVFMWLARRRGRLVPRRRRGSRTAATTLPR